MEDAGDDIYDDPKSLSNQTSVKAIAQMFAKQQVEPVKPAPQPNVPKKTWKPPVSSGGTATPIIMMKPPTAKKPDVASKPEPHPNKPAVPKRSPVSPGLKAGVGISMDELKETIKKKSTGSHSDLTGSKPQVPRRSPQTGISPTIPRSPLKPVDNSPKAPHNNERIPAPNQASPTENDGGKSVLQPLPPLEVLGEPPKKPARPPEVQLPEVQTEGQKRLLPAPPSDPDEVFEDEDGDMYEDVETARARLNKERQEESGSDIKPMEEEDEEDVYEDTENRPPPLPSPRTPGLPMPSPVPSALHGVPLPATPRHDEPEPEDDDETYDDIRPNQQGRNDSEEEGEDEDLYEGLDEVQEQVSQLDRRMGTFSHLPFRLWGSNGQLSSSKCKGSTPVYGKSDSTEDLLDKDKKARKKDEKLRKEQERKEQKEKEEREKREKKEQKRREKEEKEVKKKFKLRPDDRLETLSRGRVLHVPDKASKHDKLDLLVKQGELLTVVKMEDCPEGKWLARNADGRYGYIVANSLEMDTQSVKSSSSSFMGPEADDEGTYDDCRHREEAEEEDVYEEF